ncbi:autotransporter assembly complex protein TamA [Candidatus Bodocaedibacter vickermanii]|uniref:Translocation and assembly module TamA n=1 Tax=Candidatus Bodocaedibacter vickermanii TaxID=2741701 RepID=A0A7L9RTQ8_9PROT|nr:Translocation and assembly module TamA [Candidatus Paracaedibacteraceae bacterium 'Lake Konstanz']
MAHVFLTLAASIFIWLSPTLGAAPNINYKATIVGLELFPDIEQSSKKMSQILNPDTDFVLTSEGVLRDILKEDIYQIYAYLQSYGFYDAKIFPEIEITSEQEYKIILHVEAGERYSINRIDVLVNGKDFSIDPELLSTKKDTPIIHELILNDKNKIALFLKQSGYAFVETLDELVEINHDALFGNITYSFKAGAKGTFGTSAINGLSTVSKDYIQKFIQWKTGDIYSIEHTNKTEQLLLDTGLFDSVLITPIATSNPHEFNIEIKLTESKHNHIQFNVYGNIALSNNESNRYEIGAIPKYKHDNVVGANEVFEITAILSNIVQDVNVSLKKPHLGLFNTTGRIFFSGERRTYEAYSRLGIDGGLGLDYKFTPQVSVDLSSVYEKYSLERKTDLQKNSYDFFGFPLTFRIDTREDKIFSRSGLQLDVSWTPYIGSQYSMQHFLVKGNVYLPIIKEYFILAGWGMWHCLSGVSFDNSPIDKRVYLGGSQNLRGYSTDAIGKADPLKKDPTKLIPRGGLSALAFGLEPRFALYHPLWAAVFCDVGQISESENIFKEIHSASRLYWDVGFSLFYFTGFGPLRLDIAYPITDNIPNEKKEFKFYISFGQAF